MVEQELYAWKRIARLFNYAGDVKYRQGYCCNQYQACRSNHPRRPPDRLVFFAYAFAVSLDIIIVCLYLRDTMTSGRICLPGLTLQLGKLIVWRLLRRPRQWRAAIGAMRVCNFNRAIAPRAVILKFFVTIPAVSLPYVILSAASVTLKQLLHRNIIPEQIEQIKQLGHLANVNLKKFLDRPSTDKASAP
ncbi:MAG: hypothetical protein WC541_02815 [Dehalococcoidia bacterium]